MDTRLAEELFQEIDKDGSERVSLQEFVEAYFEQQREVEERIDELKLMIEEDSKKKAEIEKKLKEVSSTQRMNPYGIMDGSTLTVTVIEARELPSSSSYVEIRCTNEADPQKQKTQPVNSFDPVWNEITQFDITDGREGFNVMVMQPTQIGSDKLLGECHIILEKLWDQYKHDEWFELEGSGGKLRLNLHFIHSHIKFLKDVLELTELAIGDEIEELKGLEMQLGMMKKPFGFVQAYYVQEDLLKTGVSSDPNRRLEQMSQRAEVVE